MYCRSRRLVEEDISYKKYEYNFLYENFDAKTIKTYEDIKKYFDSFRIDEEFEEDLMNGTYESFSGLTFNLCKKGEDENNNSVFLLALTIEITDDFPDYNYYFRENDFDDFNDFLRDNKNDLENLYITITMDTKFNLQRYLLLEPDDNETDTTDEEITVILVENAFKTEDCTICLSNKPNILNIPCLHLSTCEKCEETGKFLNCSICRKEIKRKVKI